MRRGTPILIADGSFWILRGILLRMSRNCASRKRPSTIFDICNVLCYVSIFNTLDDLITLIMWYVVEVNRELLELRRMIIMLLLILAVSAAFDAVDHNILL